MENLPLADSADSSAARRRACNPGGAAVETLGFQSWSCSSDHYSEWGIWITLWILVRWLRHQGEIIVLHGALHQHWHTRGPPCGFRTFRTDGDINLRDTKCEGLCDSGHDTAAEAVCGWNIELLAVECNRITFQSNSSLLLLLESSFSHHAVWVPPSADGEGITVTVAVDSDYLLHLFLDVQLNCLHYWKDRCRKVFTTSYLHSFSIYAPYCIRFIFRLIEQHFSQNIKIICWPNLSFMHLLL